MVWAQCAVAGAGHSGLAPGHLIFDGLVALSHAIVDRSGAIGPWEVCEHADQGGEQFFIECNKSQGF